MATTIDTTSSSDFQLLKSDTLLRVRTPAAQRDALLDLFERGTSSAKAFAAEYGIKYPTFAAWIQQRRRRTSQCGAAAAAGGGADAGVGSAPSAMRWVEAVLPQHPAASQAPGVCCLEFAHGVKLILSHEAQLPLAAQLIARLANTNPQLPFYA